MLGDLNCPKVSWTSKTAPPNAGDSQLLNFCSDSLLHQCALTPTLSTPAAKSPRTTDPRQFRPSSLTSVVCKIREMILKEKLLAHLSQLSLLTTKQHGFLPRRSTLTNLLSAEETVTRWLDEGDTVDIVYLDFAKSFDSVNHRLLLTKLKCYGIAPSVINWIESG